MRIGHPYIQKNQIHFWKKICRKIVPRLIDYCLKSLDPEDDSEYEEPDTLINFEFSSLFLSFS